MPSKKYITIYTRSDYGRIAAAIGHSAVDIMAYANKFEAAAMWYRLAKRRPRRMPRSKLLEKMDSITKNARRILKRLGTDDPEEASVVGDARRLLKNLGIDDPKEAPDGPGNSEILEALALFDGDLDEDPVIEATRRIGRLADNVRAVQATHDLDRQAEIVDAKEAARELERRASKAFRNLKEKGDTYENDGEVVKVNVVPEGNSGDVAINDWIVAMMGLYEEITGQPARTSVVKPGQPNEGAATGPLVGFLKAAGMPLKLGLDEDALRSRVRTIRKTPRHPD